MILCADFPVFVSGVKPPGGNLKITSTLGGGDPDARLLGHQHQGRLPSGLQKILDGEAFKFDSLAEGLQQYLFYSETALRTASNDGEMPVVGKDLQAGADFMGDGTGEARRVHADDGDPTTVGGATHVLKAKLAEMPASSSTVPPASTSTSPAPARSSRRRRSRRRWRARRREAADTTQYVYKVVSTYKDAKNVTHDSIPSDPSAVVQNASTLTATKFNTVTVDEGRHRHGLQGA